MNKNFRITFNVGKTKYLISYHDGEKKHNDGSNFDDINCFMNKKKANAFINKQAGNSIVVACLVGIIKNL